MRFVASCRQEVQGNSPNPVRTDRVLLWYLQKSPNILDSYLVIGVSDELRVSFGQTDLPEIILSRFRLCGHTAHRYNYIGPC